MSPRAARIAPHRYDELFSGVDLLPTLLDLLGVPIPAEVDGLSHASNLRNLREAGTVCAPRFIRQRRITIL